MNPTIFLSRDRELFRTDDEGQVIVSEGVSRETLAEALLEVHGLLEEAHKRLAAWAELARSVC